MQGAESKLFHFTSQVWAWQIFTKDTSQLIGFFSSIALLHEVKSTFDIMRTDLSSARRWLISSSILQNSFLSTPPTVKTKLVILKNPKTFQSGLKSCANDFLQQLSGNLQEKDWAKIINTDWLRILWHHENFRIFPWSWEKNPMPLTH